jgi:glyoxylase-like metal-dependent hydrolase (beta-lactamase superfamily II)
MVPAMADRFYFRQLLSGRDFAKDDSIAGQMLNFVYLIGDREEGVALVIDPAYAVDEILQIVEDDGMRLVGTLATHFHPDHVGGDLFGHDVEGIRCLLERQGMKVHVHKDEARWVKMMTGVSDSDLEVHDSSDIVKVGEISVELIHTPGHTPGSQCFLVENRLVAGDTLFLEGCGRTDLPGGNARDLYLSLTQRLSKVPDSAVLFPGHLYSRDGQAELGETRRKNPVFQPKTEEQWLQMFGPGLL